VFEGKRYDDRYADSVGNLNVAFIMVEAMETHQQNYKYCQKPANKFPRLPADFRLPKIRRHSP
jgi:hypothetical protein